MQVSFWWWQCSERYINSLSLISIHPSPSFSPSQIRLVVSVDVKHHVYLLAVTIRKVSMMSLSHSCFRFFTQLNRPGKQQNSANNSVSNWILIHAHARTHARTNARTHAHTHTHIHKHTHTRIHTHTHTHTHKHTHTHTHTHCEMDEGGGGDIHRFIKHQNERQSKWNIKLRRNVMKLIQQLRSCASWTTETLSENNF